MRVLYSLMGLLALASGSMAQNVFPLTGLTVQATGSVDNNGNPVALSASMPVTPNFGAYNQKSLRYATEYTSQAPINVRITWSANNLYGTPTQIKFRNCASSLVQPTSSNGYSYCSYSSVATYTNGAGGNSIDVTNLWGTAYLEFLTTATINDQTGTPISYILTVGVFSGTGSNMLSLDTDYGTSNFNAPYTGQQSQYTIGYNIQVQPGSAFGVNFYFSTQSSVATVFVQECPGKTCNACDINALGERDVVAGVVPFLSGSVPFDSTPASQKDLPNGAFGVSSTTKHGRYTFPAVVGSNCLRFINRVDAGSEGTNEYTITIGLNFFNCGAFETCSSCVATSGCGWCLADNFVQYTGYGACRVANRDYTSALTGGTCSKQTGLIVPRFVNAAALCVVIIKGDPRISGLQGQDFQVHGTPNEYFNLVSTASLQVNSRFVYLDDAKCDNFTSCFSHPGTYIDEIGVMIAENKVRLVAGAINEAARVFIDGKEIKVSAHKHTAGKVSVTFANSRRIVVKTPEFMMTVSQSDKFFNVESALLKTELLDQGSKLVKLESSRATEANKAMHGLIGQTWRNNVYAGNREYEGEVSDYQVADGIWGKDFAFNLYQN